VTTDVYEEWKIQVRRGPGKWHDWRRFVSLDSAERALTRERDRTSEEYRLRIVTRTVTRTATRWKAMP
jgi:hypothetical protein